MGQHEPTVNSANTGERVKLEGVMGWRFNPFGPGKPGSTREELGGGQPLGFSLSLNDKSQHRSANYVGTIDSNRDEFGWGFINLQHRLGFHITYPIMMLFNCARIYWMQQVFFSDPNGSIIRLEVWSVLYTELRDSPKVTCWASYFRPYIYLPTSD